MASLSDFVVVSPIVDALLSKLAWHLDRIGNRSQGMIKTRKLVLNEFRLAIEETLAPVLIAEGEIKRGIDTGLSWLAEVQKAAYDADDLLDLVSKNNVASVIVIRGSSGLFDLVLFQHIKIRRMSLKFKNLSVKHNHVLKLESNDADMIISSGLIIREHFQCRSSPNLKVVDELMLLLQSKKVFGRDDDRKRMLDLLIQDSNSKMQQQLSVIPILGEDGIGKTTLARMLYDDDKVLAHFDQRVWVSCGGAQEFDKVKIAKGIIESVTGFLQLHESGDLYDLVRDALESKRSLIVLDDIQFINKEDIEDALDILKFFFAVADLGSKVIVTTPSLQVASTIGTGEHCELSKLSNDDSWSILSYLAFHSSDATHNSQLRSVMGTIVDSCRGLPLLLYLIGSLVRFEKEKRDWISFKKLIEEMSNLISSLDLPMVLSHNISNPLVLGYGHLPSHLKQCFAYCSIFTRGHVLNKEKLIQMWIAEGLVHVQSFDGRTTLEDIGNDYFRELVSRSFFTSINDSVDNIECRMHGLIYHFAQDVAGLSSPKVEVGVECRQSSNMRQVSLAFSSEFSTNPRALDIPKHLRTLLLLSGNFSGSLDHNSLFRFKRLRVLDLSCSGIEKLSSYIRNLQHLRYLDLSHTFIKKLPSSIVSLTLQTLKLFGCYRLEELPNRMPNMTNLRHLDIGLCRSLSHMPYGIGLLTSLQSMPMFVLGKNRGCAHLGELRVLNLTGKLEIKNLENENSIEEARDAKLYQKERLHHLGLSWGGHNVNGWSKMSSSLLLEILCPHPKLKVLDITGYRNCEFPSWMRDSSIHNLVRVSIRNCSCEKLPPLGQLPYLKELCVEGMSNLKYIGPEFYGDNSVNVFPSLEQFELSDMPILMEWFETPMEESSTKEVFPCLKMLTVEGCPQLKGNIPYLPVLEDLVLWNSNEKLLCSLPHLTSLSSLVINEFTEGCPFSKESGNLNSVKKLMIYHSRIVNDQLKEAMHEFTSLEHLGILHCFELTSLQIGSTYLRFLQKLDIIESPDLKLIPEVMKFLPSLRELIIDGCPELDSLPGLGYLTRLEKLFIKRCPKLSYLPEGLEATYALRYLLITGCPQLEKKVQKDTGDDWPKIAHIPCIIIGHD